MAGPPSLTPMEASLEERLAEIEREHAQLESSLADPEVLADGGRYATVARRHHQLDTIVTLMRRQREVEGDRDAARELLEMATGDERQQVAAEIEHAEAELATLVEALREALVPPDPNDGRRVIVEVRGAEGGEEANLFARDLFEMYRAYAIRKGWNLEVLGANASDLGGYTEVTFSVSGAMAWSHLRLEGGPHRVQRVPVTESQGRIHTSSATVTVLPEADELEVTIDPADLSIDVYRSSGPGGQSVNTTDSAVRITHLPTGLVVSMQDEKSQLQNKAKAMRVLRSRLLQAEQERAAAASSAARRGQVGGGGRSEKIRTYNVKENRVTDHRIGLTVYKLDRVIAGDLDLVVEPLLAEDRARRLAEGEGDTVSA
jgi:peptide chain release factor 1